MFAGGTYSEGCGEDSTCARPTLQEAAAGVTTSRVGAGNHQCPERVHDRDILNETPFARNEHCDFTSFVESRRLCTRFEHCFDPHKSRTGFHILSTSFVPNRKLAVYSLIIATSQFRSYSRSGRRP
jgi:hypothetical protein